MTGKINQITRGRQHLVAAPRDLAADIRQHHIARPPLDHGDAKGPLEIADLHREGRLRDRAGFRRPAEMAVLGERREIAKLPERNHPDQIN